MNHFLANTHRQMGAVASARPGPIGALDAPALREKHDLIRS
jgi:hypothetical protein